MDCLFCKILNKQIPAQIVYQDEQVIGFKDINPQAKVHLLFIHKGHTANVGEMVSESSESLCDIFTAINKHAVTTGLDRQGYRVVTNVGQQAGQSVFHTHFHVLAGEKLSTFGA